MFTTVGKPEAAYLNQMLVDLPGCRLLCLPTLCKHKPWWVLLASLSSYCPDLLSVLLGLFTFRNILPGRANCK